MPRPKPTPSTTVLIVENEAIIRLELATELREMGMVVLTAKDADDAIGILDLHPEIALLVTDIRMPGSMDGLRLAHHVRDRWPPLKIIVASGLDTDLSQLPAGSVFLAKPYRPEGLSSAVARVAGGNGPRSAGPSARAIA